jgi:hypothetical protein
MKQFDVATLRDWLDQRKPVVLLHRGAIPPTPRNYERITALNESGPLPEGDPTALEAGVNRCAIR